MQFFDRHMRPQPGEWVADLGCGFGDQAEYLLERGLNVIALDIRLRQLQVTRRRFPGVFPVLADALRLPFKGDTIQLGFSNAVLEHLPAAKQGAFVEEFCCSFRRGIIFTPSKYCPVEPHFMLPFFQFVPKTLQRHLCSLLPLGTFPRGSWESINLISIRTAQLLAPRCRCFRFDSFLPGDQVAIVF